MNKSIIFNIAIIIPLIISISLGWNDFVALRFLAILYGLAFIGMSNWFLWFVKGRKHDG